MERSLFYRDRSIDLRSERDKSVYFGHRVVIYFTRPSLLEKGSNHLPCFPSKGGILQSAILFILSTTAAIITQTKSYEISTILIHTAVKLNFTRFSVCLRNALSALHLMTSRSVIFIDVIGTL